MSDEQTQDELAAAAAATTGETPAADPAETAAADEASASDASSQTVVDGGATPDVPTEQIIEVGEPLSVEHAREFPTAWHRDAYIAGLKREIEGARIKEDDEQIANAEAELARVTGGATPAKKPAAPKTPRTPAKRKLTRPRGAGKQTR